MEGMGEEKLYFPLLKSVKHQKAPLGGSVSTHFVADSRWGPRLVTAGSSKRKPQRAELVGDLGVRSCGIF